MSLDYRLTMIDNWREVCLRPSEEHPGSQRLARKTNALIWAGLLVELGTITKKNADEWDFRLRCIYKIGLGPTEDKDRPNIVDIVEHIGLRTNVGTETRRHFMNRVRDMVEQSVKDDLWSEDRKAKLIAGKDH